MRIIYSLVFTLFCASLSAQFGISAKYNSNSFEKWNEFFSTNTEPTASDVHSTGFEFGVNYWRRLKAKRIEFLPEISYSRNSTTGIEFQSDTAFDNSEMSMSGIHFNLPIHFYFLDLHSDCDCPTFSKQSDFLSKGLYVFLSPGISYNTNSIRVPNIENNADISNSHLAYRVGVGLGYDVGLSDLLTITPFISYNYGFSNQSKHLDAFNLAHCSENGAICEIVPIGNTRLTQLQVGIRVSFRPDYQSNNF